MLGELYIFLEPIAAVPVSWFSTFLDFLISYFSLYGRTDCPGLANFVLLFQWLSLEPASLDLLTMTWVPLPLYDISFCLKLQEWLLLCIAELWYSFEDLKEMNVELVFSHEWSQSNRIFSAMRYFYSLAMGQSGSKLKIITIIIMSFSI